MLGNRLNNSRLRQRRNEPDVNPIESLVNLADCMLVLAVGAMLALVINWNLDIGGQQTAADNGAGAKEKLEEVGDVDSGKDVDRDQLKELGRGVIYVDPDTGEAYLFTDK